MRQTADHETVAGGRRGAGRRGLRVRDFLGRGPVERQEGRAEGVETETAVRRHAGRSHVAGEEGRLEAGRGVLVPDVQNGRAEGHAVHHGALDKLRDRVDDARRQDARPLGHEGRRTSLPIVSVTAETC